MPSPPKSDPEFVSTPRPGPPSAEVDERRKLFSAAPFAGIGIHVHEGSSVAPGVLLVSPIPDTVKLIAHLYASEQKSGFLKVGQIGVRLRCAIYPYQKYGMARGTVTSIAQRLLRADRNCPGMCLCPSSRKRTARRCITATRWN